VTEKRTLTSEERDTFLFNSMFGDLERQQWDIQDAARGFDEVCAVCGEPIWWEDVCTHPTDPQLFVHGNCGHFGELL